MCRMCDDQDKADAEADRYYELLKKYRADSVYALGAYEQAQVDNALLRELLPLVQPEE